VAIRHGRRRMRRTAGGDDGQHGGRESRADCRLQSAGFSIAV